MGSATPAGFDSWPEEKRIRWMQDLRVEAAMSEKPDWYREAVMRWALRRIPARRAELEEV